MNGCTRIQEVLIDAIDEGISRTSERIDEAIKKARSATSIQRQLFQNAATYNRYETLNELTINQEHSKSFVLGMFKQLGVEIVSSTNEDALIKIRVTESIKQDLRLNRERYDVTLDRQLASIRPDTHILDMGSPLMGYLLAKAKSYGFAGQTAVVLSDSIKGQAVFTSILRWQNDQGNRLRQELAVYLVNSHGKLDINPKSFSDWLKTEATTGSIEPPDRMVNMGLFDKAEGVANQRLSEVSNEYLHPENLQWVSAGWLQP